MEMNNDRPYIMSFSSGGLCQQESIILTNTYFELKDWKLARSHVLEHNLFQSRMASSAKRVMGEVYPRLRLLSNEELSLLNTSSEQDQKHLLWIAVCRRHQFIADFMIEVVHDRYFSHKDTVGTEEFNLFWIQKSVTHPEVEKISDLTREKLRTVLFRMMREVGLLSREGKINPIILSPMVDDTIKRSDHEDSRWFTSMNKNGGV